MKFSFPPTRRRIALLTVLGACGLAILYATNVRVPSVTVFRTGSVQKVEIDGLELKIEDFSGDQNEDTYRWTPEAAGEHTNVSNFGPLQ